MRPTQALRSKGMHFGRSLTIIRELKKLRRQLQGKRLIKTELCVKLSLLRLFHVDHVVGSLRSDDGNVNDNATNQ